MEDNKYYTPTIEEFRVGFEFEVAVINLIGDNPIKWVKQVFDFNLVGHFNCENLVTYSVPEVFRVKRLDCDDIIDCGFEYDKYHNRYLKDSIISITLNNGIVHIKDRSWKDDDTVDDTLFIGTIKNKSELQMILKMIGA